MRISTDASHERIVEVMSDDPVLAPAVPEIVPEVPVTAQDSVEESVSA